ncbi:unnamed protein product [Paramecium pentaurelia]|uniref:Uncharacterized protein n=1 Tax=Paramecium pentaurelia TaxID=43138 RepID=A0A8S1T2N1_9CILI|nr:unnamed protein product [Paramecium pentaurelia]
MSLILQNQQKKNEEKKELIAKTIRKQKRKNQYTVEFPFGSKIDLSILKSISKISQILPPSIPSNIVFRLNSNIQIPQSFNQDYQLGCLSIDPHSFNYKVIRYDKCQNFHIFHFEPIERQYTPASVIKDLFDKQNTRLGQVFDNLHSTKLNTEKFKVVSEQVIDEFEKKISSAYSLYISKYKDGTISTVARVMNDQYLKMIGINETMIYDYITSTGCLPWPYQQTQDNQWDYNLLVLFTCNEKQVPIQGQAVNYNGNLFPVFLNQYNYYLYNEQEQSYTQFQYYIYEYNEKWSNDKQIRQNYLNYYNKRLDTLEQMDPNIIKRCKYKTL